MKEQLRKTGVTGKSFSLFLSHCYSVLSFFLGGGAQSALKFLTAGKTSKFPLVARGDTAVGVFQMQTGALCVKCNDYFG